MTTQLNRITLADAAGEQSFHRGTPGLQVARVEHTPGPWTVNGTAIESAEFPVAYVQDDRDVPVGDWKANARLIAAAPEMYAAIKQQLQSLDGRVGDFQGMLAAHRALDAAIAKVEGRE
jgi:hypothetical protein